MKLVIGLLKSVPVGLVPVKKQVSKKGKVFTQTFYVKPEDAPKAKKKPKQETAPSDKESTSSEPVATNRGDGFYAMFAEKYFKIPQSVIAKKFSYKGFDWVVFNSIEGDESHPYLDKNNFRCVEITTGRAGGGTGSTVEDAIQMLKNATEGMPDEHIANVINNKPKVKDANDLDVTTTELKVLDKFKKIEDFKPYAKQLLLNASAEKDINIEDMMAWMYKHVQTEASYTVAASEIDDPEILKDAVANDFDYESAKDRSEALQFAIDAVKQSVDYGSPDTTKEDILKWANKNQQDLTYGISDVSKDPIYDNSDNEVYNSDDILAYAVKNDISVEDAYATLKETVEDQDRENEEEEALTSFDYKGKHWNKDELIKLADWVGGSVKSNRHAAKMMFSGAELGRDVEEVKSEYGHDLLPVALENGVEWDLNGAPLYRGTQNPDVKNSQIGDVIPLGMASFSKIESVSNHFTDSYTGTVFVLNKENNDKPAFGIDLHGMIESAYHEGYGAGNMLGIDAYPEEKEFIVVAPALKIKAKEVILGKTYLYVEAVKMELLDMLKSKFSSDEERLNAISAAFDVPLHEDFVAMNGNMEGEKKE